MVSKKVVFTCLGLAILAVILVLVLVLADDAISPDEEIMLETSLGPIKGKVFYSRLRNKFMGFRGIRYAEPPINDLRFRAPVPVKAWSDVFDATDEGPSCPQKSDDYESSEDCLRLNVYTNELPSNGTKPKPVIAFIHGGGLSSGSAISSEFGAEYLLDRDVVLVTFNYRLGSLGFMSTGTKDAPGNNGFKDQTIALRWIRDNIEKFGGDPTSVTLMGQGAGGRSVMLHLVSPMSEGLFHRAVIMSGAVTGQWEIPSHQLHLAKKQAQLMNCPQDNVEQMVECLRKLSGKKIGKTFDDFKEFDNHPIMIWYPVVEPDFGQERFLTQDPNTLFASGNFSSVPIIIGVTNDEFAEEVPEILDEDDNLKAMNDDFEKYAAICFMYERDTILSRKISRVLWSSFIGTPDIRKSSFEGLKYLFSDGIVGFAVHRFVQLAHKSTPIFYYKNVYVGKQGNFYYPKGSSKPYGVAHSDDLIYIFKNEDFHSIEATHPDARHMEQVLDLWTSFAAYGIPKDRSNSSLIADLDWTPFVKDQQNYLEIGETFEMKSQLFVERYQVWESIFPMTYP